MENLQLTPKPERSLFKKIRTIIILLLVVALYVWTFTTIDIDWGRAIERALNNFHRVIPKLFSPDWSALGDVSKAMLETVFIAFAGSLMAAIIAVPLAFLAANNMMGKYFSIIGKWILSAVRAFPDLILAMLFVVAVGPNPVAGVLAIAIGSAGMLGKM